MLIFFCATGAWQLFGFHRGTKDGSYSPPGWLQSLSTVHQHQNLDGFGNHTSLVFRWFALALAVGVTLVGLAVPALFLWLTAR